MKNGDEGEQDVSYDSKFILGVKDEIGNYALITYCSIRVVNEEIIYPVMYNMGVNGKNEALLDYSDYLKENYIIVAHHQVPWSTETKLLALAH